MIPALLTAWFAFGWLLITELSYLPGGRSTIWLYNRLAALYPRKTRARAYTDAATQERILLAPLRELCQRHPHPCVYDLGCGSGRAGLLLVRQPWFNGSIFAVDLSEAMLAQFRAARAELPEDQRSRIAIVHGSITGVLETAPHVDVCLLLELGEFIPAFPRLLRFAVERLSPGGLLVLTRPAFPYSLLFPFRAQTRRALWRLLRGCGLTRLHGESWRRRYAVVHAWRPDTATFQPSSSQEHEDLP